MAAAKEAAPSASGWSWVREIRIRTTDEGPFLDDFFWVFVDLAGEERVAPDLPGLLEQLQGLPGFDNQAVIEASGCTEQREFLCWRRAT